MKRGEDIERMYVH